MKVLSINQNQRLQNITHKNSTNHFDISKSEKTHKSQSFGMSIETGFKMPKKLKASLYIQKILAKMLGQESNIKYYELGLLEGLQEGIDVFKGLKLKQIAFLGEDLHSVMTKRGCYSRCSYCYPGAEKPVKASENIINEPLFEDIKSLADGFKTLKKRSGINFIHSNSETPYSTLVFDADNIEVALKDIKGNIHEFPEINRILYEATGTKGIFDTTGWNILNPKYQKRAQNIVEYYSNPKNMEELHQFNISINPFHSTLEKVNELRKAGNIKTADRIYDKHIERLANALFTCIPICGSEKFNTIRRAFNWNVPNMQGYYFTDELNILNDVYKKLTQMCENDLNGEQKHIKSEENLKDVLNIFAKKLEHHGDVVKLADVNIDTHLIAAPKLEKLVKERNPQIGRLEFYELFKDTMQNEECFERMKEYKKYRSAYMNYLKMVDSNGKVYITDAYRVIPTDIQLNFANKNKQTQPFSTIVEDFVLTKEMI